MKCLFLWEVGKEVNVYNENDGIYYKRTFNHIISTDEDIKKF